MATFQRNILRFSLAESDYYFKEILLGRLLNNNRFQLISKCNNGHELITQLYKRQEDFFLIDLFMPVLSGLETIKFIRHLHAEIPVIVYAHTYQEDIESVLNKYKQVFFCQKKSEVIEDILLNCILSQKVNHQDYLNKWKLEPGYIDKIEERLKLGWYKPSIIEIQLMKLCYEGLSNKEMGQYLNLSARTVDTYITRLTQKLGLRNKIDLIRFAVENGFYNITL